jgi:hypothetical protein
MSAFTAGFDSIANHITLIALPVIVDLFLWLGPHLKLSRFLQPFFDSMQAYNVQTGSFSPEELTAVQQVWMDFIGRFNLFSILRTFPIGPSSLMSLSMPVETPLGSPLEIRPGSILIVAGWGLLILLVGWILGSLYFHGVSKVALSLPSRSLFPHMLQAALLSLFWLVALAVIGLPALFIFALLSQVVPAIAQGALFLVAMVALWLVLPVFFSPHGIFTRQQDAMSAIRSSLQMIRYTLPTSGLFLMGFIIISQGLAFLWRTPAQDSWWTLVGIAGHAFITTALLAASFVYYRDVNAWLTSVMEKLKPGQASQKA